MTANSELLFEVSHRFTGHVQGVGFRWRTREIANEMGISGFVQNCSDGSVLVVTHSNLSKAQELCSRLSALFHVERVESTNPIRCNESLETPVFHVKQ